MIFALPGLPMICSSRVMLFVGPVIACALPASVAWSNSATDWNVGPTDQPVTDQPVSDKSVTGQAGKPVSRDPNQTTPAPGEANIKPRLELYVPSVHGLLSEALRSRSGIFVRHLGDILLEIAGASSEGVGRAEAVAFIEQLRNWPDTSISAVTFAPDTEGRARWAVRVDWPLGDLHDRLDALLRLEAAQDMLRGVTLTTTPAGYRINLGDSVLGYILGDGSQECKDDLCPARSTIASHDDLPMPSDMWDRLSSLSSNRLESRSHTQSPSLLVCRLNMTATEEDSGATFLSSFSAVTALDYSGRVNEEGEWIESVRLHWPPISGMAAKALFGSVKQTFFVPDEAFGALAINSMMIPGMLDAMAGFGPEAMLEEGGEVTIVGEVGPGPIAHRAGSQICATLLPGTGFLPMPDFVIQSRTRRPERFINDVRAAVERANKLNRERERGEPWHEVTVRQRPVFWRDGGGRFGAMMMPLVLKPVIFTTKEVDAKGRERDFVVVAWTSTVPEDFVRRWLDFPRTRNRIHLPSVRKMNGQLWINWDQVYRWVHPYLDLGLSVISTDALLPRAETVAADLTHAWLTADLKYAGLTFSHRGPVPLGALVVPVLVGGSLEPDASGGSDLARERLACQRLRVLYHHCKLFKKDLGRWPAEIAELDGYVDFEGHPGLLELRLSAKKRWSGWFKDFLESPEEDNGEDEDDDELDTDLYEIDWRPDRWTLGYAPGTFEHLEQLYIDQDGKINRVERKEAKDAAASDEPDSQSAGTSKGGFQPNATKE